MAANKNKKPGRKTYENSSPHQAHDVLAIVRGAFRALKLSQSGGWDVAIHTSRSNEADLVAKVVARWRPPHKAQADAWYTLDIRLQRARMDQSSVTAFAGHLMEALDKLNKGVVIENDVVVRASNNRKPWWQHDARWSDGMEVRLQPIKPKLTTAERVAGREDHARKMLARAERDAAKAQARVDRWQAKTSYYDRKAKQLDE